MSWMDSWSRPSKHAATPPPLYLTQGDSVPYCQRCGRVISSRRTQVSPTVKYCSDRCKHSKPGRLDRKIEDVFVRLLNGADARTFNANRSLSNTGSAGGSDGEGAGTGHAGSEMAMKSMNAKEGSKSVGSDQKEKRKKKAKGDPRIVVACEEVESIVFGAREDPTKVYGRKKNRASRALGGEEAEWRSVDMESGDEGSVADGSVGSGREIEPAAGVGAGTQRVRPPQTETDVNFSVGGERGWAEKIEETAEMADKRKAGLRRAEEREMVRRAARRGCAFGFVDTGGEEDADLGAQERPQNLNDNGKERVRQNGKWKGKKNEGPLDRGGDEGKPPLKDQRRRKCEAVMNEQVVEASFAKGEFAIRWREEE